MSLFNFFKKESEEDIPLDIACSNALILLTEYVTPYGIDSLEEIQYLSKKITLRDAFIVDHFEHLFEDDTFKNIHQQIPNDDSSRTKLLVDSINSLFNHSDKEFAHDFIVRVTTIFNFSKDEADRFSETQIRMIELLEKLYNHDLPIDEQILVEYDGIDDTNGFFVVRQNADFTNNRDKMDAILQKNELYKTAT